MPPFPFSSAYCTIKKKKGRPPPLLSNLYLISDVPVGKIEIGETRQEDGGLKLVQYFCLREI